MTEFLYKYTFSTQAQDFVHNFFGETHKKV